MLISAVCNVLAGRVAATNWGPAINSFSFTLVACNQACNGCSQLTLLALRHGDDDNANSNKLAPLTRRMDE